MQAGTQVNKKAVWAAALLMGSMAAGVAQAAAAKPNAARPTVGELVKSSSPADWRALDPQNTLYMDTRLGRIVIELAPAFAPKHVENIKILAREQYWDGLAIIRSQDNWVAQWGDPDEKNPRPFKSAKGKLEGEFTVPMKNDRQFTRMKDRDGYAPQVGHSNGFPSARNPRTRQAWLLHCYGMVGVGRDNESDSGNGSSLYAVTGHAPRHLDRNITVVGRVVSGMPLLASLPRGAGAMGFYDKPELNVPITSVKVAADVPEAERTKFEVMRTDSAIYKLVLEAQRNRGGPWTKVPAGHLEICNAPIPVREAK
jgi:peptidylprolyl isomerase